MSSVKLLCKSTKLNRCIATDRRWKKQASHSSPERLPNLRPSSLRNFKDEELKAPKFSIAIGWKIWCDESCDTSQPFALLPFSLPMINVAVTIDELKTISNLRK